VQKVLRLLLLIAFAASIALPISPFFESIPVGFVAEGVFLFLLMLCIGAGDILLDFALQDERSSSWRREATL
jgi:hypothetical protein